MVDISRRERAVLQCCLLRRFGLHAAAVVLSPVRRVSYPEPMPFPALTIHPAGQNTGGGDLHCLVGGDGGLQHALGRAR